MPTRAPAQMALSIREDIDGALVRLADTFQELASKSLAQQQRAPSKCSFGRVDVWG